MQLRPYQKEAVDFAINGWRNTGPKQIIIAPTGAGKTVIVSEILQDIINNGGRALFLAHRTGLCSQARRTFEGFGIKVAVERGVSSVSQMDRVVISSMQTMSKPKRLAKFKPDSFTHVLIDEAHHILAKSYQDILAKFHSAKVLGVTATPAPGTVAAFDSYFEILRKTLEDDGFLAKPIVKKISLAIDLRGAKLSADKTRVADGAAGERIEPHLRKLVDMLPDMVGKAPGVVFLPLVSTSEKFRDIAAEHGIKVEHVDGTTSADDREAAYDRVRSGKAQILSNAALLTEGFDLPALRWVCVLRPVESAVYYEQAIGRAARIAPGKSTFLVLDPMFLSDRHVLGGIDILEPAKRKSDQLPGDPDPGLIRVVDIEAKIAEQIQTRKMVAARVGELRHAARLRPTDGIERPTPAQQKMLRRWKVSWAAKSLKWDPVETKSQGEPCSLCLYGEGQGWACHSGSTCIADNEN